MKANEKKRKKKQKVEQYVKIIKENELRII